jgi:hypothetical protein
VTTLLRGRILEEPTKPRWKSHLPLPCNDEVRVEDYIHD